MNIEFLFGKNSFKADLDNPIDISIPLREGDRNPNCYWADPPGFETIISGDFVGSVARGGPVNYQKITITPHGNGTHTECYGHISSEDVTINQSLKKFHFVAELITIEPSPWEADFVITKSNLENKIKSPGTEGLIVRTLPNSDEKILKKYSGTNPPYFEAEALIYAVDLGVAHLLVDLPSVDRESDGGKLAAHKNFWQYPDATRSESTITELIFVPNEVEDGLFLVNLQIISLETDACPSKPLLFPMTRI